MTDTREGVPYTFRPYEPGDEGDFLDLYELVWDRHRSREWFRWRYLDLPYLDHVPMFVVVADGRVVATRPFLPLRMVAGDETPLALLPVDTMVHPDHRRRGLFTALTERSLDYYTDRDPAFVFNQPNAAARSGYRKLDWRDIGPMVTFFRVQNPTALAGPCVDGSIGRLLVRGSRPLVDRYLDLRDHLASSGSGASVTATDGVQPTVLSLLYRRAVPDAIHAVRDEPFYRWRFASPLWDRTTYLAYDGGEPVVGLLVRTRRTSADVTLTQFADVVPMSGGDAWLAALRRLVARAVEDHADSDVVAAPARAFPDEALRPFGFRPDDEPPLSWLKSHDCRLVVRTLDPTGRWTVGGASLLDPAGWQLSVAERDSS